MEKKKETYTVMILPNPTSTIHRFCVTRKTLKIILGTTSILALLLIIFLFNYISMAGRVWELNALKKETASQKIYIQSFRKTMDDIKEQMTRIKDLDAKLRVITNLAPPPEENKPPGMGGREETPLDDTQLKEMSTEETPDLESSNLIISNEVARGIEEDLDKFRGQAELQELSLKELMDVINERQAIWASTPSIWPVDGFVTSGFGVRVSPFTEKLSMHSGIDISARPETPIVAPAIGRVAYEGYDGGLGKSIRIDHGYGIQSVYGHLSKISVKIGQRIKRGSIIGFVGNTGLSTGPHLHYEILQKGKPVNPLRYILN